MSLLDRIQKGPKESSSTQEPKKWSRPLQAKEQKPTLLRTRTISEATSSNPVYEEMTLKIIDDIYEQLDIDKSDRETVESSIGVLLDSELDTRHLNVTSDERRDLLEGLINEILGLGPLTGLLRNDEISDILVNGPYKVYVEKKNKIIKTNVKFRDDAHLMKIIGRIVNPAGRRVDISSPMTDCRMEDGSRVNVIIPPLSLRGPLLTIRKFSKKPLMAEDLVANGTCTLDMMNFLKACVNSRLNIVVSGGGGAGKTTTLNILSSFIPGNERIITIEDAAELQLQQRHVITLETRTANIEGSGKIATRDLVINALRMRPDRIVVGECRGGEALDMLQAMNTGHDGSLSTLHANGPEDALSRIEVMVLMAGHELPSKAIRQQIGSAIHLIVHQIKLRDGSRKISKISEIIGFNPKSGKVDLKEIFTFRQEGITTSGKVFGQIGPTGEVPIFMDVLQGMGQKVDLDIFSPEKTVWQNAEERNGR